MIQINSVQQQPLICPPFSAPRGSGVRLWMGRSPFPLGVRPRRLSSSHHGSPDGLWAGHRSFGSGRAIDGGQPNGIAAVSRQRSTSSDVMATSHGGPDSSSARVRAASHGEASTSGADSRMAPEASPPALYSLDDSDSIRVSWETLMRWSKTLRSRNSAKDHVLDDTDKVVVMGGGSFGTAMAAVLAENKPSLDVAILLRDVYLAADINETHCNTRYLPGFTLPSNVRATTDAGEAIDAAGYALHAVPVQASRRFLESVKALLPMHVPVISVSKGLEVETGQMMSELIPSALNRDQPTVFVSGPSFAREVIQQKPTCVLAASRDPDLAAAAQQLFANEYLRVNTSTDVTGVEVCGALKNVLAIAAGIVEGQGLGNNALAALICQGCSEVRWLAERMGARPETVSGLSGLGDIMLTCYGSLSRNRTVGMQLGQGRHLNQILSQSSQVAEGVATAGVVVKLARTYRVSLPVLTAVASVLDGELTAKEAVDEIMLLPQLEER